MQEIRTPLIVLGYGEYTDDRVLLAVDVGENGVPAMLPVFTDPEKAELYRRFQAQQIREITLPISMLGTEAEPKITILSTLVIPDRAKVRNVLEAVMLKSRISMVALDPPVDGSGCLCYEVDEFLELLLDGE